MLTLSTYVLVNDLLNKLSWGGIFIPFIQNDFDQSNKRQESSATVGDNS